MPEAMCLTAVQYHRGFANAKSTAYPKVGLSSVFACEIMTAAASHVVSISRDRCRQSTDSRLKFKENASCTVGGSNSRSREPAGRLILG